MTDSEFNDLVDTTFAIIEEALDNSGADIDCDNSGGSLTITSDNGAVIVFSRQPANQELWLAAASGGYHFVYHQGQWFCPRFDKTLAILFAEITRQQIGQAVVLAN